MKVFIALLALVLLADAGAAPAASDADVGAYPKELETLSQELSAAQYELGATWLSRRQLHHLRERVQSARERALKIREQARGQVAYYTQLLEALGPPPQKGEPPEAPDLEAQRKQLDSALASFEGVAKKANVLTVQATTLLERIASAVTRMTASELLERGPAVWSLSLWASAFEEVRALAGRGASSAPTGPGREGSYDPVRLWSVVGGVLLSLLTARMAVGRGWRWVQSRAILAGFSAASMPGIRIAAGALLPLSVAAAVGYASTKTLTDVSLGEDIIAALLVAALAFFCVVDLARIALRPASLQGGQAADGALGRRLRAVSVCVALSLLVYTTGQRFTISAEFLQVVQFVLRTMIAAGTVLALSGLGPFASRGPSREPAGRRPLALRRRRRLVGSTIRRLGLVIGAALVAANPVLIAFGFNALADELFVGALWSVLLVSAALLGRVVLSDLLELIIRRVVRPSVILSGLRPLPRRAARLLHMAAMGLVNVLGVTGVAYGLLSVWGVDVAGLTVWGYKVLEGIEVGDVRISIFDIGTSVFVLLSVLVATRLLQRFLAQRVFPNTRLDEGAEAALYKSIGYLGLILSLTLAVAAVGVDLTELALVLGGLAVGIGFGLQHIAGNIVSGLVMLAERPIKPGDWVAVKEYEGLVHRIGLRATELRNFQNASCIVPNAEIISGTITNWTHKDRGAFLKIAVTLVHSADDEAATRVLLQCARTHRGVLQYPAPQIYLRSITPLGLRYELWAYLADARSLDVVQSDLCRAIARALPMAGVHFALDPELGGAACTAANEALG
jgi:potassium efflux system protein